MTPSRAALAKEKLSVFRPLISTFGCSFLGGSVLKLVHDMAVFIAPKLLQAIIHFAKV